MLLEKIKKTPVYATIHYVVCFVNSGRQSFWSLLQHTFAKIKISTTIAFPNVDLRTIPSSQFSLQTFHLTRILVYELPLTVLCYIYRHVVMMCGVIVSYSIFASVYSMSYVQLVFHNLDFNLPQKLPHPSHCAADGW